MGEMLSLNLMDEAARLKTKLAWTSGDRVSESLVKNESLNILLMVLKKGARLAEHRTRGPIAFQVLSGLVCFSSGDRLVELSPGKLAALGRGVVHELEALEESVAVLITAID